MPLLQRLIHLEQRRILGVERCDSHKVCGSANGAPAAREDHYSMPSNGQGGGLTPDDGLDSADDRRRSEVKQTDAERAAADHRSAV